MSLTDAEKNRLKKLGLKGLNKPKMTPKHPTKKAVVAVRCDNGKIKATSALEIAKAENHDSLIELLTSSN